MGLSQTEFGRRIGISPTCITQIERGYRKPWPKIRRQLTELLNMAEEELFDSEGWPKKVNIY